MFLVFGLISLVVISLLCYTSCTFYCQLMNITHTNTHTHSSICTLAYLHMSSLVNMHVCSCNGSHLHTFLHSRNHAHSYTHKPTCTCTWHILAQLHLDPCPCTGHMLGLSPCVSMYLFFCFILFCYSCIIPCMCPLGCAGGCWICTEYNAAKPDTGGALRLEGSTPLCVMEYCLLFC